MSQLTKIKKSLDYRSLRGRYIYISLVVFVLVSVAVIFAEKKVEIAADEYQRQFSEQYRIENEIENFVSKHETMKSMLLEYLILPEKLHYDFLEQSIDEYDESFIRLEDTLEEIVLNENQGFKHVMEELQKDVKPMIDMVEKISKVRSDAEVNFPFTKVMLEDLTENNNELLGSVYEAIDSIEGNGNSKLSVDISRRFRDIRYYWVRMTTEYRLMVTIRFGVFVGDWQIAFDQIRGNIEQYKYTIEKNIRELEAIDKKELLSFEASESLQVVKKITSESFVSYDAAIDLIESSAWRVDILLWESRVEPGFEKVSESLNELREELQKYQLSTMSGLSNVPHQLSISLWLVIFSGVVITVIGYLIFDRQILKSIAYVTSALVKQSQGKEVVMPAKSSIREISELIDSYGEMYKQVESSKLSLESLVSDKTESLEKSNQRLEGTLESLRKTRQSEIEAEKASEAKTTFLANMSHEIRTPMNVILGYTQIMQHDEHLSKSQSDALNAIKRSGNHLLMLINNILDISKIEAGDSEIKRVDFDLRDFINDLYIMFKVRADGKGISWDVVYDVDVDVDVEQIPVHADEGKINQVLINLIGNAVKFTDKGGVTLTIKKRGDDQFYFEVSDTGFGIAKKSQEEIFKKFSQEENGIMKGGTGLGLSISKTQVEAMGGELEVDSIPGEGSKFFFTLELPSAETAVNSVDKGLKYLPENISLKALVVDDIEGNRAVLSQLLSLIGLDVVEANDGESAIILAKEYKPEIIFMDFHMPGINGLEALHEIKEALGDTFKAVVVTAHAFDHDVNAFKTQDVSEVIRKPFNEQDIYQCLSELMSVELVSAKNKFPNDEDGVDKQVDFYVEGIPETIMSRLIKAVEYCEITEIENIANEVSELSDEYRPFAETLLSLSNKFDTDSLQKIVNKVQ